MKIPEFLSNDDYLQNPVMNRFLKEKEVEVTDNTVRSEYINKIEEYADIDEIHESEVKKWLLRVVKEGSKEFCYRKINGSSFIEKNPILIEAKIKEMYPNCPKTNLLDYSHTEKETLIDYVIDINDNGEAEKICFTFSRIVTLGEKGIAKGSTIFPVFVEVYLNLGLIVSRCKAKSTIYQYDEQNPYVYADYKINTMGVAISLIDKIINIFDYECDTKRDFVLTKNGKLLYKLYSEFSFTPNAVIDQINSVSDLNQGYIVNLFEKLNLDKKNMENALIDMNILVEKYISINGNNETYFKNDRKAYLVKVSADDPLEYTRIDTSSSPKKPLQCFEAFYDSKKTVIKNKSCEKLSLCLRRHENSSFKEEYVQILFGTNKNCGFFKSIQYAEEEEIQYVLQAISRNY
ncbi:MAG: hypothetical protein UHN47_16025 [Lachnospiraceae bacterium]|nr:hypothetical protein [Lachnospiraceae bacterium]